MVQLTIDEIRALMYKPQQIRNVTVIAPLGHGKSTLIQALYWDAGIMLTDNEMYDADDTLKDICERVITIEPMAYPIHFTPKDKAEDVTGFFLNILDSPGDVDLWWQLKAALRVTDGAVLVIDCVGGVATQADLILKQALVEYVKPILFINKLDRALLKLELDPEEMYQFLYSIIDSINSVIALNDNGQMGKVSIDPSDGTVAFGSALYKWGFSLKQFAEMYAEKFNIEVTKLMMKFWGDNFFNVETKKWAKEKREDNKRSFCLYVLDPIYKIFDSIMSYKKEEYEALFLKLSITLKPSDRNKEGIDLFNTVMASWLPLSTTILQMVTIHLPSPVLAQKYRTKLFFQDSSQQSEIILALKNCSSISPLMMFVSRLIPTANNKRYAFGRVFSGKVSRGSRVTIMGTQTVHNKKISGALILMDHCLRHIEDVPCGNFCVIEGVDPFITMNGTITTFHTIPIFKEINFGTTSVVKMTVTPKNKSDLLKFIAALKDLSKADPGIQYFVDSGVHTIEGLSENHLERCAKYLCEKLFLKMEESKPVVSYRETITKESVFPLETISVKASPMTEDQIKAIENGHRLNSDNILCYSGINILSKSTNVNKIKASSFIPDFKEVTRKGVLIEENLKGVIFTINNVTDAEQIKRCLYSCLLNSAPRLMEPIYECVIVSSEKCIGGVYQTLNDRAADIINEQQVPITKLFVIKAFLAVNRAFGFHADLKKNTRGEAVAQCLFHHWDFIQGDPLDRNSECFRIVQEVRRRKGLPDDIRAIAD